MLKGGGGGNYREKSIKSVFLPLEVKHNYPFLLFGYSLGMENLTEHFQTSVGTSLTFAVFSELSVCLSILYVAPEDCVGTCEPTAPNNTIFQGNYRLLSAK